MSLPEEQAVFLTTPPEPAAQHTLKIPPSVDPRLANTLRRDSRQYSTFGSSQLFRAASSRSVRRALRLQEEEGSIEHIADLDCTWGFDPNWRSPARNMSPLAAAAKAGDTELCRMLLEAQGDPNMRFRNTTVLMIAARHGQRECVKLLVKAKGDVAAVNPKGQTALHLAAAGGYTGICGLLATEDPGTLHVEDSNQCTPAALAVLGGHREVFRLLIKRKGTASETVLQDGLSLPIPKVEAEILESPRSPGRGGNTGPIRLMDPTRLPPAIEVAAEPLMPPVAGWASRRRCVTPPVYSLNSRAIGLQPNYQATPDKTRYRLSKHIPLRLAGKQSSQLTHSSAAAWRSAKVCKALDIHV